MRPRIPHPLAERHRSRASRTRHSARVAAPSANPTLRTREPGHQPCDPALERAQRAGGPIDEAYYVCACGCMFSAAVSTTVSCPHCGADQAW